MRGVKKERDENAATVYENDENCQVFNSLTIFPKKLEYFGEIKENYEKISFIFLTFQNYQEFDVK